MSEIKNCALNLLSRREHSRHELRNKLKLRKFPNEEIEIVLNELVAHNLQSDKRFVEGYIRMRMNKGYGPLRIQAELQERGVAADVISQYLQIDDPLWREHVIAVHQKKFGKKIPKDFTTRAKQMRFIQYRGYTTEQMNLLKVE